VPEVRRLFFIQEQHTIARLERRELVGYDKERFALYESGENEEPIVCPAIKEEVGSSKTRISGPLPMPLRWKRCFCPSRV